MGSAAEYRGKAGPKEVEIDGDVWVVRGMTKAGHAHWFSGLHLLAGVGSEKMTQEQLAKFEATERGVYDAYVDGVKNPESGAVESVPYDSLLKPTFDQLWRHIVSRGSLDSATAAEIRGAL